MDFNRKNILLYQEEKLKEKIEKKYNVSEEELKEKYLEYQNMIFDSINKNPLDYCIKFTFDNILLVKYFFIKFELDGFNVSISYYENYSLKVTWLPL